MVIAKGRLLISAALGILVAAALHFVQTRLSESSNMNIAREVASIMMMPALLVTLSTSQIHNRSIVVISLLDFIFYTLFFYGLITVFSRRKQNP